MNRSKAKVLLLENFWVDLGCSVTIHHFEEDQTDRRPDGHGVLSPHPPPPCESVNRKAVCFSRGVVTNEACLKGADESHRCKAELGKVVRFRRGSSKAEVRSHFQPELCIPLRLGNLPESVSPW